MKYFKYIMEVTMNKTKIMYQGVQYFAEWFYDSKGKIYFRLPNGQVVSDKKIE